MADPYATMTIETVKSDEDASACFPQFQHLRPHLDERTFLERYRRQVDEFYEIAFIRDGD